MTEKRHGLLQIPQGTEGLHLEEAFRHRKITKHIEKIFTLWGYLPVETPVFDFFDTYSHLLSKDRAEQTYRLIDREGELLMLRSDITLFLAKQMSLILSQKDLPIRVFYADTILRYESHEDISSNEFFQTGCELIGKPGREGDLEILLLLYRIFKELKLESLRIHIGSRSLLNSLSGAFNKQELKELYHLISVRESDKIKSLFCSKGYSLEKSSFLVSLLMFIGTVPQFETLVKNNRSYLDEESLRGIDYLLAIGKTLYKLEGSESFRIDISEIGGQDYYTGIVFSAYLEGLSTAAASGGRYDSLFNQFAYGSSVGFSLLQRKIEPLLKESEKYAPPSIEKKKDGEDFLQAYKRGRKMNKEGRAFLL